MQLSNCLYKAVFDYIQVFLWTKHDLKAKPSSGIMQLMQACVILKRISSPDT